MKTYAFASLVVGCLAIASPGQAATITFGSGGLTLTPLYTEAGLSVTFSGQLGEGYLANSGDCAPSCASSGTRALLADYLTTHETVNIFRTDLTPFSMLSFFAAETQVGVPTTWARMIRATGSLAAGGSVVQDITLDLVNDGPGGVADFQQFFLPAAFGNVTRVEFTGLMGGADDDGFQLDNIEVGAAADAAVPEPASLTLLASGLAAVAWRRRNRG
jgi:hypothetical protein